MYVRSNLGAFGKGFIAPPPPPADVGPTITPEEEAAILQATLPPLEPEPSFLARNSTILLVGGGAVLFGTIGMILLLR